MLSNNSIITDIKQIIEQSRENAIRSVDFVRVQMYWQIGKRIFEEEQEGKERADYGSYLIRTLAKQLEPEFGSGFAKRQVERMRQFYRTFPIASALRTQLKLKNFFEIYQPIANSWRILDVSGDTPKDLAFGDKFGVRILEEFKWKEIQNKKG